jgi:hypothetical protein
VDDAVSALSDQIARGNRRADATPIVLAELIDEPRTELASVTNERDSRQGPGARPDHP